MKVLLLGDFSSLHSTLKEGLEALGHEVCVASAGDAWKKLPRDIDFSSRLPGLIGKLHGRLKPLLHLDTMKGFDVVQLINPFIIHIGYFPYSYYIFKRIINQNDRFFILGAGDDSYFWRFGRKILKYGPFDGFLKYDLKKKEYYQESDAAFDFNASLVRQSAGIIPVMYEYEVGYSNVPNRLATIPLPIDINKIKYMPNKVGSKLVIFHGLNRYGFKGTGHVEKAFRILSEKYPDDLETVIDGHMPLSEYLAIMRKANIVIDQVNSYSCGMNALYALAMGKVVIGGAEPESLVSLGVSESPVVNVKPSAQSIVDKVEQLLVRRNELENLGYLSRKYVEDVHDHIKVAQRYIDVWNAV